jgi:DNA primase large subunit
LGHIIDSSGLFSEELHEWFIRQELALFRYRFDQEPLEQKKKFLSSLNFNWDTVKEEEKAELRKELTVCSLWLTSRLGNTSINAFIENETFFKVDFAKVPDLVRSRYVFVKAGKAYVPMLEQVSLVLREYKRHLEDSLKV